MFRVGISLLVFSFLLRILRYYVEDASGATHPDGSGGRGSSNRTLTGSAAQRAHTPTPPPVFLLVGPSGPNEHEVTQRARGSS